MTSPRFFPMVPSEARQVARGNAMLNMIRRLVREESAGEVLEYALIAGLIVVAAITVIASVGGKVLARWNSLNASM